MSTAPAISKTPTPELAGDEAEIRPIQAEDASNIAEVEDAVGVLLKIHRSFVEEELTQVEREVRLIPYNGFPSDSIGRNGDLVLDELSNTLYGPKARGVWPLEGVQVHGAAVSRRNRIRLSQLREENSQASNKGFVWLIKAVARFLLTGRLKPAYVYSVHFKR